MLVSSLSRALRCTPLRVPRRHFSIFDPSYYHKVFDETLTRNTLRRRIVKTSIDDKGTIKEIEIYGVPLGPIEGEEEQENSIKSIFTKPDAAPVFLQIDPTKYMHSQRSLAIKGDLEVPEVERERVTDMLQSDPIYPYAWEEALVNPDVLTDQLKKEMQSDESAKPDSESQKKAAEADKLVSIIEREVLDGTSLEYYDLNNVLYYSLLMGHRTVLGSTPKILKRLIIGNSLTLTNLQEVFQSVAIGLGQYHQARPDLDMPNMAHLLFPELFHAPEVVYMTVFMKELAKNLGEGFKAFVGVDYADPIADHWSSSEIAGTSFSDIAGLPLSLDTDSIDDLIEKHALLDVLLEGDIWEIQYIKNKFPYLPGDKSQKFSVEELQKKFLAQKEKYNKLKEAYIHEGEKQAISQDEQ